MDQQKRTSISEYMAKGWPKDKPLPGIAITRRTAEPLLKAERPWEDFFVGYVQVLREGGQWHMWYGSGDHSYRDDRDFLLCYARSDDGIRWERPDLGLVEYKGGKDNNIILDERASGGVVGHCIFLDPSAPRAERFKIVFGRLREGQWWIFGGSSADGCRWKLPAEPLLKRNSDTQMSCFRDGDRYRMYLRMWSGGGFAGKRIVGYTESATFGDFADPVDILAPDAQDPGDMHFYNNAASKLAGGLYVMFPSAFYTGNQHVLPHLAISRDGRNFQRVGRQPVIQPGKGFDSSGIYVGPGAVPGEKPGEFWFYYDGHAVAHDDYNTGKDRIRFDGAIGRFLVTLQEAETGESPTS